MHTFPGFGDTECDARFADILFRNVNELGQVAIGKAIFLGLFEHLVWQHLARVLVGVGEDLVLFFDQFEHLFDEVVLDLRAFMNLFDRSALTQCFIHDELAFR